MFEQYDKDDDVVRDYRQDGDQVSLYADIGLGRDGNLSGKYHEGEDYLLIKDEKTSEKWKFGLSDLEESLDIQSVEEDLEFQESKYNNGIFTASFELKE